MQSEVNTTEQRCDIIQRTVEKIPAWSRTNAYLFTYLCIYFSLRHDKNKNLVPVSNNFMQAVKPHGLKKKKKNKELSQWIMNDFCFSILTADSCFHLITIPLTQHKTTFLFWNYTSVCSRHVITVKIIIIIKKKHKKQLWNHHKIFPAEWFIFRANCFKHTCH